MKQATQLALDGKTTLYRWYVWVGTTRFVTWAATPEQAIIKAESRLASPNLKVSRIAPAPSMGEEDHES